MVGVDSRQILPSRKYAHWSAETLLGVSCLATPGAVTREVVDFLRSLVNDEMKKKDSPRRIYISRNDVRYRRIVNERDLFARLQQYGFKRVTLSHLSFVEQIRLFATAEVVVAPHGAGLANLVFSPPGCQVIELIPKEYINVCFWALSEACGHNYSCFGGLEETGKRNCMHVDLETIDAVCTQSLSAN